MDGDMPQVNTVLDYLANKNVSNHWNLTVAKYNAGCSLSDSPNDAGHCHSSLKNAYHTTEYNEHFVQPIGRKWEKLKQRLLHHLDTDSFETYWPAIATAKSYIGKAFSDFNVQASFATTGLHPFDTKTILGRNSHYKLDLSDEQRSFLHDVCLPKLIDVMKSDGYIAEDRFESILSGQDGVDNCAPKTRGQPLNLLHTSYQRCVLINTPEYLAHVQSISAKKSGQSVTSLAQDAPVKVAKKDICFNKDCRSIRNHSSSNIWTKCGVPYCSCWSCSNPACVELLQQHQVGDHSKSKK